MPGHGMFKGVGVCWTLVPSNLQPDDMRLSYTTLFTRERFSSEVTASPRPEWRCTMICGVWNSAAAILTGHKFRQTTRQPAATSTHPGHACATATLPHTSPGLLAECSFMVGP